ncbi:glycosyltransferase [Fulvivirga sp.]|uniref:glycosyltransferase n=1 Tax=Fulvivirga sp. TaxID=1931237 RepID=UPI0032EB634B
MKDITLIVPVFNEEESLEKLKETVDEFIEKSTLSVTVLFVNDGSTDRSCEIIQNIIRYDANYTSISLDKNCGLSTAIKAGIDISETPWIAYMDADMQTTPLDLINYYPFMPDYDMINGIRRKRKDSYIKKISSLIANTFRRYMIKDGIEDTCCPLKLMKTDVAKSIPFFKGMHRFMPALVQLQNKSVKQLEVKHFERYAGTAKYHLWNRLTGPFLDTLAFVWMRKRYINYTILTAEMKTSFKKEKVA